MSIYASSVLALDVCVGAKQASRALITLAAMLRQGGNLESLGKDRLLSNNVVGPVAQRPRPAHVDAVRLQRREQRVRPDAALARRLWSTRGALPDGVDEVLQSFTSSQRADRPLRAVAIRRQPPRQRFQHRFLNLVHLIQQKIF